ncbi:MAG: hypothetical protein H6595_08490 [Flavobacteriales bacterium]|nr:hypothetical protein [Flavobacteriales bacterium]MCB9167504.1 hypothetical protein [Flavobacteriales bacterium]
MHRNHAPFLLAIPCALLTFTAVRAQDKPYKPDHRFAYSDVIVEDDHVKIEMKDVLAEIGFCKFRFKVTNKTGDFIFVDPGKFKVSMDGKNYGFSEKPFMLKPHDDAARTLNLQGGSDYHKESWSIDFADGFEVASAKGNTITPGEFTLPPAINSVTEGPFTIELRDREQSTKRTVGKFNVKYAGSGVGIVDPARISVKIPAGQVYANANSKAKPTLLSTGEDDNFDLVAEIPGRIADMQFTTLTVVWNDAFIESTKQPFTPDGASFSVDQVRTAEINK